jgi:hypothetical protein
MGNIFPSQLQVLRTAVALLCTDMLITCVIELSIAHSGEAAERAWLGCFIPATHAEYYYYFDNYTLIRFSEIESMNDVGVFAMRCQA